MYTIIKTQQQSEDIIELSDLRKLQKDNLLPDRIPYGYYVHNVPQFPKYTNKIYWYKDFRMNLYQLTCSCEWHNERRKQLLGRDIRLVCYHLYHKIKATTAKESIDDLTAVLLDSAVKYNEQHLFRTNLNSRDIYFGIRMDTPWINVYSEYANPQHENPEFGHYVRGSYNPLLHRWSYGIELYDARKIEYLLDRLIENSFPPMHPAATFKKLYADIRK
jgi:hypothetical protein